MSKTEDGGPAFPRDPNFGDANEGMSLRAWFAGMAMQGLLASLAGISVEQRPEPEELASVAAFLADAMLEALK